MIIARLIGGLGNQMFQYAFAVAFARLNHSDFKLDINDYTAYPERAFALDSFGIRKSFATANEVSRFFPERQTFWQRALARVRREAGTVLTEKHPYLYDAAYLKKLPGQVYLLGYWARYLYFEHLAEELKSTFQVQQPLTGKALQVAEEIRRAPHAVALHVRRGDYTTAAVQSFLALCPLEYYQAAASYLARQVTAPHFFIFSDDIAWCRENIRTGGPQTFVDLGHSAPEDLRLMTLCDHNIIANSTFSWWGAWLNANPQKIVVAPACWYADKTFSTEGMIPPDWLRM